MSVERAILVAERFIASLTNRYGRHPVSTDGGHLVSASMQVPETETPFAFPFSEKPDRKDGAVHQGQDRML